MTAARPNHDLAVVIVSIPNEPEWLGPCLGTLFEHAGELSLDVVVVENDGSGRAREVVERFPGTRAISCENRGFAHANNQALATCCARYVLLLNPDTEVHEGHLDDLVSAMDRRPQVGLAGGRQVLPDGTVFPTIRRFPNALRAFGEALGSERLPFLRRFLGERELDMRLYDRETPCDWTSGSFMLIRRKALDAVGPLDEAFFLYSEETDLCLRIKKAGWEVIHLPRMTIIHHIHGGQQVDPRMEAQFAYSRLLYARKHFAWVHRTLYVAALRARYRIRRLLSRDADRRHAGQRALATLAGTSPPPFEPQ